MQFPCCPFGKLTKLKIKITGADTPDKWDVESMPLVFKVERMVLKFDHGIHNITKMAASILNWVGGALMVTSAMSAPSMDHLVLNLPL